MNKTWYTHISCFVGRFVYVDIDIIAQRNLGSHVLGLVVLIFNDTYFGQMEHGLSLRLPCQFNGKRIHLT